MTRNLTGHWAYTVQGLMQYLNPFKLTPEKPKRLEVGLALKNDLRFKDQYNFYDNFSAIPLSVLNLKPFDPPRDTFPYFSFSRNFPWITFSSYPPASGYMPFAESGHMRFSSDGTITGKLWFTLAGFTTYSSP